MPLFWYHIETKKVCWASCTFSAGSIIAAKPGTYMAVMMAHMGQCLGGIDEKLDSKQLKDAVFCSQPMTILRMVAAIVVMVVAIQQ